MKYSLFLLEKKYHRGLRYVGEVGSVITEKCMEYVDSFDTLEEAEDHAKHIALKTIILNSYWI